MLNSALNSGPACSVAAVEELTGVHWEGALALARNRHAVGDGSDIARLGHQQMMMSAVVQEVSSSRVLAHRPRPARPPARWTARPPARPRSRSATAEPAGQPCERRR